MNDGGIRVGGSSWAKKMVVLRTEFSGMCLFYKLFVCHLYVVVMLLYVELGFLDNLILKL